MELALAVFNIGAGLGILAVGVAVVYLAWRVTPLVREARALTADLTRLARTSETELRPLLEHAREVAHGAEVVTDDAAVKVERLGQLLTQLEGAVERIPVTVGAHPSLTGSVESVQTPEDWSDR